MTEKVLLNSGYKYYPDEHYKRCDKFYSKTISKEPTKAIRVLYYHSYNDEIDEDFEYEYIEEKHGYWYKAYIWGLDKNIPYTIEEIENILINGGNNEK